MTAFCLAAEGVGQRRRNSFPLPPQIDGSGNASKSKVALYDAPRRGKARHTTNVGTEGTGRCASHLELVGSGLQSSMATNKGIVIEGERY